MDSDEVGFHGVQPNLRTFRGSCLLISVGVGRGNCLNHGLRKLYRTGISIVLVVHSVDLFARLSGTLSHSLSARLIP